MHPRAPRRARASILARAQLVEDLVQQEAANNVRQYVILGAGLGIFAHRRLDGSVLVGATARGRLRSTRATRARLPSGDPTRCAAAGTPFVSFVTPPQMLAAARDAGFREAHHVSAADLGDRYFADRTDGLRPSSAEELLLAQPDVLSYRTHGVTAKSPNAASIQTMNNVTRNAPA
jgi:O-methyltransferase involved in polyketide biosynthesis